MRAGEASGRRPIPPTGPSLMQIAKYLTGTDATPRVGVLKDGLVHPIASGPRSLTELLHDDRLEERLGSTTGRAAGVPLESVRLLAPIDAQEVWGAGVTYERSKVA